MKLPTRWILHLHSSNKVLVELNCLMGLYYYYESVASAQTVLTGCNI